MLRTSMCIFLPSPLGLLALLQMNGHQIFGNKTCLTLGSKQRADQTVLRADRQCGIFLNKNIYLKCKAWSHVNSEQDHSFLM